MRISLKLHPVALGAVDRAFDFHLQVGVLEFRASRHIVKRCGKAARQGAEQQLLRRPAALKPAQFRRFREVDRIGRGLALGQSGAARRPPGRNAIGIFSTPCLDSCHSQKAPPPQDDREKITVMVVSTSTGCPFSKYGL